MSEFIQYRLAQFKVCQLNLILLKRLLCEIKASAKFEPVGEESSEINNFSLADLGVPTLLQR